MSDPFNQGPPENKPNPEPERQDKTYEQPIGDQTNTKAEQAAYEAAKRASAEENAPGLSKIDLEMSQRSTASLAFSRDKQAPYALKKSEFLKTTDSHVFDIKPIISNFLNDTKLSDEHKLSVAELKELSKNREALSNAKNMSEAVEHALQLTRLYQHLRHIEEEKKARDLLLGLEPHDQHGRELFKELERMHPPDLSLSTPVLSFPGEKQLNKRALRRRITNLSGGKVIVLGDLLIDELLEGKPERISREAPVLILEHVGTELILGGAANTAANLASLGGLCHAIGICGRDEYAKKLARLFEKAGITHALVEDPARPTTVKTRILSSAHALRQQLLRMDRISRETISLEIADRVLNRLQAIAGQYSALILSDYRSGLITDSIISSCLKIASESGLKVVVDAQNDFARFKNAFLITPNQPDTEAAVGFRISSREDLEKAGAAMLRISGAEAVLLTRGGEGMALFQRNQPLFELPVFNRSEIFDVTGAGDTVVATMTLALVTGASMPESMALGNLAAGIVVKKPGTAVTNQKEMLEALDSLTLEE